ncbi:MAG: response regulator transcription factor [Chloroflexi bacterium]|nr:response regulator transcription factor [Chloroflexota bacterium]
MATPRPLTVLLVDDQPEFRDFARELLQGEPGLEVIGEAFDCESAMQALALLKPDVVVLDVQLPGINGFAICKRMRDVRPDLSVVMTSAFDHPQNRDMAARVGARGFVRKGRFSGKAVMGLLQR